MASVWRGIHPEHGIEVAVKILTSGAARDPDVARDFQNEVRAIAALDHPNVITVLDLGTIDDKAEANSRGRLISGSPYLVMEHASDGSLTKAPFPTSWDHLAAMLLRLLDALAHAHARGVIHRDLKPGNVLVCGPSDPRPGLKLSDFGISFLSGGGGHSSVHRNVAGTLRYMAPEQIEAKFREYGPWTDLYALGCMAWIYATGRPPFTARDPGEVIRDHLSAPLPDFEPRIPCPSGTYQWLAGLLAKNHKDRYQRAADAAAALRALGTAPPGWVAPTPLEPSNVWSRVEPELTTFSLSDAQVATVEWRDRDTENTVTLAGLPRAAGTRPPIARDWRAIEAPMRSPPLVGAGLALYRMRRFRMAGRNNERDTIWEHLVESLTHQKSSLVVLRGATGTGKTRLAEFICHRAHELGLASVISGDAAGLSTMLAKHFRCGGLRTKRIERRLHAAGVPDADLPELVALVTGRGTTEDAATRCATICREIVRVSETRGVVLFIDDAQWTADGLELCDHLLTYHRDAPVLVMLAAQDEALAERRYEADLLARLEQEHRGHRIVLGPLTGDERAEMVRDLLGLEPALAARVEERTQGNPQFAVQLVGDWVERDALKRGPTGFKLRSGDSAPFPDDLHALWVRRVDQVLLGLSNRARTDLECAAAIGQTVPEGLWHEAADMVCGVRTRQLGRGRVVLSMEGLRVRNALVDRLVANRLANRTDESWQFAHALVREALERTAREAGRWTAYHAACAEALRDRIAQGHPVSSEQIGTHLREAGQLEEAIGYLLQGVVERERENGVRAALALMPRLEETMRRARTPRTSPHIARLWMLHADLCRKSGLDDDALRWSTAIVAAARQNKDEGWAEARREATLLVAAHYAERHDVAHCKSTLASAAEDIRRNGTGIQVGRLAYLEGFLAWLHRDFNQAAESLRQALSAFRHTGAATRAAACLRQLAGLASDRGHHEGALKLVQKSFTELEGNTGPLDTPNRAAARAACLATRADIERRMRQTSQAIVSYRAALERYRDAGCRDLGLAPAVGLGLALADLGEAKQARQALERAQVLCRRRDEMYHLGMSEIGLAVVAGHALQWVELEHHLRSATPMLAESRRCDRDTAAYLELIGDLASRAGRPVAAEAYQLAGSHWQQLGFTDRANRIRLRAAAR